jgi:hypothetical protein
VAGLAKVWVISLRYRRTSLSKGVAVVDQQSTQSVDTIEADIEATRRRLAATIDELTFRVHPKEVLRREVASLKARISNATHTPEGELRLERVAAVGAAVAALVALVVWRRRHDHRR